MADFFILRILLNFFDQEDVLIYVIKFSDFLHLSLKYYNIVFIFGFKNYYSNNNANNQLTY